jgi:hypothetical protein
LGQVEDQEVFATLTTFVDGILIEEALDEKKRGGLGEL